MDVTITNLLEGKVGYDPVPTLQEVTSLQGHPQTPTLPPQTPSSPSMVPASNSSASPRRPSGSKRTGMSSLFSTGSSPALFAMQRQLTLEERKGNMLEQARRYVLGQYPWALRMPLVPYIYSTYYKPMGDLPYVSSEQGGLIIHTELIYEFIARCQDTGVYMSYRTCSCMSNMWDSANAIYSTSGQVQD